MTKLIKEWQIASEMFDGKRYYRVGRLKNAAEPPHRGNIEYYHDDNIENGWTEFIAEAEDLAIKLNEEGIE